MRAPHLQDLVFGSNNFFRDHITTLINIFPTTLLPFTMSTIDTMRHPLQHLDNLPYLQQTHHTPHTIQLLSINYDTHTPNARTVSINDLHRISFYVANTLQFFHLRLPWGRSANFRHSLEILNTLAVFLTHCRQPRVAYWEPQIADVILDALSGLPHLRTIHFSLYNNCSSPQLAQALRSFFQSIPFNQLTHIHTPSFSPSYHAS